MLTALASRQGGDACTSPAVPFILFRKGQAADKSLDRETSPVHRASLYY